MAASPDGSGTVVRPARPDDRPRRVRPLVWGLPVALVVLLADQVTKSWAVGALTPGRPVPMFWTLQLNLTFNSGIAFSGIRGAGVWVVPLALAVVGVVLYMGRHVSGRWGSVALGLIAGGAIGNIVDRLLRDHDGAVVDFLDLQWWPIFNVADMAVVGGGILLVLSMLTEPEPGTESGPQVEPDPATGVDDADAGERAVAAGDDDGRAVTAIDAGDPRPTGERGRHGRS